MDRNWSLALASVLVMSSAGLLYTCPLSKEGLAAVKPRFRILFFSNHLGLRGTEVAIFDYALWGEIIYNFDAFFLFPQKSVELMALKKFNTTFPGKVLIADSPKDEVDGIIERLNIGFFYKIVSGQGNEWLARSIPTGIHAVFDCAHPQGSKYIACSDFVQNKLGSRCGGVVPHIAWVLDCGDNLREELGIASSSFVFAWYGGHDAWDPSMTSVVRDVATIRNDSAFVLRNFPPEQRPGLSGLKNVHLLDGDSSLHKKCSLLKTADVFLHTRTLGETFGLAVAEFSLMQKAVITRAVSHHKYHLELLKSDVYTYQNQADLRQLMISVSKTNIKKADFASHYHNFSPAVIMQLFTKNFLDSQVTANMRMLQTVRASGQRFSADFFDRLGYKMY